MNYERILLIDDDEDDREIFLTALAQVSDTVVCTPIHDASIALKKLENKQITPDVIFLDLNMPVMNGQQFLSEIKKKTELRNIPVIIFSTSSHPATIQLTKELGAQEFITKPDKFDDIISMLRSFLGRTG